MFSNPSGRGECHGVLVKQQTRVDANAESFSSHYKIEKYPVNQFLLGKLFLEVLMFKGKAEPQRKNHFWQSVDEFYLTSCQMVFPCKKVNARRAEPV